MIVIVRYPNSEGWIFTTIIYFYSFIIKIVFLILQELNIVDSLWKFKDMEYSIQYTSCKRDI